MGLPKMLGNFAAGEGRRLTPGNGFSIMGKMLYRREMEWDPIKKKINSRN